MLIAGITCLVVLLGLTVYSYPHPQKVLTQVYVPTFQRGDCFRLVSQDEVWNTIPDGIVERVGNRNYLIIWKEQADKRGGSKYGSTIEIKVFDELNTKISCPTSWLKHTHKN